MKYDFDKVVDRRGTNCVKHDFAKEFGMPEDLVSLWVADMDFQAAEPIRARLGKVVEHGVFGYSEVKDGYKTAVQNWYKTHFGWKPEAEWMVQTPGIVFALSAAVRAYTQEKDAILIQPPVYHPFRNSILNNNRTVVTSPLNLKEGHYEIDFEDFEAKIKENDVKMFILCSPHNPVSRVWKDWELKRIVDICCKYQVLILCDEIHSDFTFPGVTHHVLANLCSAYADHIITCTAPSKTFNLAGLQASNIFISNPELREKFRKELTKIGFSHLTIMGMTACQAAYEEGEEWLTQLKEYLVGNLNYVRDFLQTNLPQIKLIEPEGTYLLWLDFRALGLSAEKLEDLIVNKAGVWLDAGTMFGEEGTGFERVNIACPRSILEKAMEQLKRAVEALK